MITFNQQASKDNDAQHIVVLSFHQRVKGRLRIETEDGLDAGIVTERGVEIKSGDKFSDEHGRVLEVRAEAEAVSVASTSDTFLFSRACYHIGNRHAEVEIQPNRLIYLNDPVLDDMLSQLGLAVSNEQLPFSPESGAYSHGHSHASHNHDHDHSHKHGHTHAHHE